MFFPILDFGHLVLILIRKLSHNPRSLDAAQKKDKKWSNSLSLFFLFLNETILYLSLFFDFIGFFVDIRRLLDWIRRNKNGQFKVV